MLKGDLFGLIAVQQLLLLKLNKVARIRNNFVPYDAVIMKIQVFFKAIHCVIKATLNLLLSSIIGQQFILAENEILL